MAGMFQRPSKKAAPLELTDGLCYSDDRVGGCSRFRPEQSRKGGVERMKLDDFFDNENERPLDRLVPDGGYTAIFRTIACIGDSLSSGEFEALDADGKHTYHDMYEYSWGQYLARMCGSRVYNFSRGGMSAKWYCDSFADEMDFWNPQYAAQAYIVALGVNDILNEHQEVGTAADIDRQDWRRNKRTFAGYYGEILQRMQAIQPRAKFFLMTMPSDGAGDPGLADKEAHRRLLYSLAGMFENTYVLDFLRYAPAYDEKFRRKFYLLGHMNPVGYRLTALMVASYIDYIIRHNMDDFKEVGFIGTDLHG